LEEGEEMSEEYKYQEGIYYTKEHEWAKILDGGVVLVGISDYAQAQLHEIVFVELPEVDSDVTAFEAMGAVESVKAVSDTNSPVSGKIIEVNDELLDSPEMINEDPYGEGWIIKIEASNLDADLGNLMDIEKYKLHVAAQAQ
jgi:glycine cleavage system H protein